MSEKYHIFGAELSPYSVKVRSYFRYKNIPHTWIIRDQTTQKEYNKYAKIQIVPLVITPENKGLQDSTPIIQLMEKQHPDNTIAPKEIHTAFVSRLLEEYADEWMVKCMFHYRWRYPEDQVSAASRFAELFTPTWINRIPIANRVFKKYAAATFRKRQKSRLWVVGSNENTEELIEKSFSDFLQLFETHLQTRHYCFGFRPSIGDFGLWGQLYNAWTDPTANKIIESSYPKTLEWIHRMLDPKAEGEFELWEDLKKTLMPILKDQLGAVYLPWLAANNQAITNGDDQLSVNIKGENFSHSVGSAQKYHLKSFTMLLKEYQTIPDRRLLDFILEEAGCVNYFQ
jgi:glutathione S-transferase